LVEISGIKSSADPTNLAPEVAELPNWQCVSGGRSWHADDDEDDVGDGEIQHEQTGGGARTPVQGHHQNDNHVTDKPRNDYHGEQCRH